MKFAGEVGFRSETVETSPGIFEVVDVTRRVRGNVLNYGFNQNANQSSTIDNLRITQRISIVADRYSKEHIENILWVKYKGVKWKVESVTFESPRIILNLGGVYNGPEEI